MNNRGKSILATITAMCMLAGTVVSAPTQAAAKEDNFVTISAGDNHSMAIKEDGSLWAWGYNKYGQLGDGTTKSTTTPVKIMDDIVHISAGGSHSAGIKADGSLWTWGFNGNGQLGYYIPYYDYESNSYNEQVLPIPKKIMDGVTYVSAGGSDTAIIKSDGHLWDTGLLWTDPPDNVEMDDIAFVSASYRATMAIKTDGTLWGWGVDDFGKLAHVSDHPFGSDVIRDPEKIMSDASYVSSGGVHAMIIKTDGSLWACGFNLNGEIGDGTTKFRSTHVKIMDAVLSVSAGDAHTVAVKEDGSLWSWGYGGRLGDGTAQGRLAPVKIMDDVAYASAGDNHTIALKTDGSLWAWGNNEYGQLGDGTTQDRLSPVKIMDGVKLPNGKAAEPIVPFTANNRIILSHDGEKLDLKLPVLIVNDRAMYPYKEYLEALGGKVEWDAETKTAKGMLNWQTVEFTAGSDEYKVNGKTMQMDAGITAFMKGGKLYIPIRYAAEKFGFSVEWNEAKQIIDIR